MWNEVEEIMCKTIFGWNIYVRSKFSCVRSSHDQCARAHVHTEGALMTAPSLSYSLGMLQFTISLCGC